MMLFIVRKKWGWAFRSWVKDNDGERETWHVYDRGIANRSGELAK